MQIFSSEHILSWCDYLKTLNVHLEQNLEKCSNSAFPLIEFSKKFEDEFEEIVLNVDIYKMDLFFREIDYLFQNYLISIKYKIKKESWALSNEKLKEIHDLRTHEIKELKSLFLKFRMFILNSMPHTCT